MADAGLQYNNKMYVFLPHKSKSKMEVEPT